MSVYNGLTRAQWDNLTKLLNILNDKCKDPKIIERTNEFRKSVVNESYKLVINEIQEKMRKLHDEQKSITIQGLTDDIPDYLKAALSQYKFDEQAKFNKELSKLKAEIVDINNMLVICEPTVKGKSVKREESKQEVKQQSSQPTQQSTQPTQQRSEKPIEPSVVPVTNIIQAMIGEVVGKVAHDIEKQERCQQAQQMQQQKQQQMQQQISDKEKQEIAKKQIENVIESEMGDILKAIFVLD